MRKPKRLFTYRPKPKKRLTGRVVLFSSLAVAVAAAVIWASFFLDTAAQGNGDKDSLNNKTILAKNNANKTVPLTPAAPAATKTPGEKTKEPQEKKPAQEKDKKKKKDKVIYKAGTMTNSSDMERSNDQEEGQEENKQGTDNESTENDPEEIDSDDIEAEEKEIPKGKKAYQHGNCIAVENEDGTITIYNKPSPSSEDNESEDTGGQAEHLRKKVDQLKREIEDLKAQQVYGSSDPDLRRRINQLEREVDANYDQISALESAYGQGYNDPGYSTPGVNGIQHHNCYPSRFHRPYHDTRHHNYRQPPKVKKPVRSAYWNTWRYKKRTRSHKVTNRSFTGTTRSISSKKRYRPRQRIQRSRTTTRSTSRSSPGTRARISPRKKSYSTSTKRVTRSTSVRRSSSASFSVKKRY